jgi:hypothetical protein
MMKKYLVFAFTAMLTSGLFVSCNGNDDPIDDGKIDPGTIAKDNLIAYWGFEDSPVDAIAQRGVATSAVKYTAGRRGKAYQGGNNSYISFDLSATDKLATLKQFTVAAWVKAPKVTDKGIGMFFQLTGTEFLGSFAFFQENVWGDGGNDNDFLGLKTFFSKKMQNEGDWVGHDWKVDNEKFTADKWFHVVHNYDNATSKASIYVNGQLLMVTKGPYSLETRYRRNPDPIIEDEVIIDENPNNVPKLGDLDFTLKASGNKGIIGFWANRAFDGAEDDWMGYFYGMLDELRIYDKALSEQEIKDLYDAEVTQIN